MTESDYIRVSNLARLRIADRCLRDCIFLDDNPHSDRRRKAIIEVQEMIDDLFRTNEIEVDDE